MVGSFDDQALGVKWSFVDKMRPALQADIPQSGLFRKPVYLRSIEADSSDVNGSQALRWSHELTVSQKNRTSGCLPSKNTPIYGFPWL